LIAGMVSAADPGTTRMDQVLDAAIANERELAATLEAHRPVVETYVQTVKPDPVMGSVPVRDSYFFGRLELTSQPQNAKAAKAGKPNKKTISLLEDFHSAVFKPEDFSRMLILDRGAFDRTTYEFHFLRSEFLGDVRTLVFDVTPHQGKPVDPSDVLPDGRGFNNVDQFKKLLLSDKDQLARALTFKLLTYATGAAPTVDDRKQIEALV
jgi:hypothetical protein